MTTKRSLYFHRLNTDGTESTYDIHSPHGEIIACVPHWDDQETAEMKAELIVAALNEYSVKLRERIRQSENGGT